MLIPFLSLFYKHVTKPIFFLFDPEMVHNFITSQGEFIGRFQTPNKILSKLFAQKSPIIKQGIAGIAFDSPLGLAAGFDYEAKLTQILAPIGFGFQTVGTITNLPYKDNRKPILGRLPKSKSLMVNKGFKNMGARKTADKLANQTFQIPLGISIGKTNSKQKETQKNAIVDILQAFRIFESSNIKNLDELLLEIDKLKLKKPERSYAKSQRSFEVS